MPPPADVPASHTGDGLVASITARRSSTWENSSVEGGVSPKPRLSYGDRDHAAGDRLCHRSPAAAVGDALVQHDHDRPAPTPLLTSEGSARSLDGHCFHPWGHTPNTHTAAQDAQGADDATPGLSG